MKISRIILALNILIGYTHCSNNFDNILLIINYNHAHYESIPLLKKIYHPTFKNIVFYGPEQHPDVHFFAHNQGYLSYMCIADAMQRYPKFDGYLFLMDDCILNTWPLKSLDLSKLWLGKIRFLDSATGNSLNIYRQYTWNWWNSRWGQESIVKAFDQIPDQYKKTLAENWGEDNVAAAYSDIAHIPSIYRDQYIELAYIFGSHQTFLELALPTIISCLSLKNNWLWLSGNGINREKVIESFKFNAYFNHPVKLSYKKNQKFISKFFKKMQNN